MHADLIATYRLQLSADFDLDAASSLVPYLGRLGISHVYLSPVLEPAAGSTHGYDVADPTRVNSALGGEPAMERLFSSLRHHGMAALLDIVPNHMAATADNPWWWDVLRNGRESVRAPCFDIDWDPPDPELRGKILVPVLGDHLGTVLERGELEIISGYDGPQLAYFGHRFPISPETSEFACRADADVAEILAVQHYRLAHWRSAAEEINYRRFFDIATLVAVRAEDLQVMEATHGKLFDLAARGPVDGFRVDHPDGLTDPRAYFLALRERLPDLWIVAEKILESDERLRPDWPVDGTTGYDFIQRAGGLLIAPSGEKAISDFYADFTGHAEPYGALVRNKKRAVLEFSFDGDLRRLVEALHAACLHPALRRDHSRRKLRQALGEIIASFPIYRTYVQPARGEIEDDDRQAIAQALSSARRREVPIEPDLLDLIEDLLTTRAGMSSASRDFVNRFQQLTAPVMAKGVEDTTFYCYDRLLALNEVGCDPARFGVSPAAFHEGCTMTHRDWPRSMLTTSTHDTKRGEDVRARISLLSEIPDVWAEEARRWSEHNRGAWQGREPDRNAEHLLYQTLVGAWPIETGRVAAYMEKACREAKTHTSWTDPDVSYEERIAEFVRNVLADEGFIEMLESFVVPLVRAGRVNSLSQTLLKLTAPGIPDMYQGCELWDDSLVDPDNRRPVDYELRAALLDELEGMGNDARRIMERIETGMPKLHLIRTTLELRRRRPQAFAPGDGGSYVPLPVSGPKLGHALAFSRGDAVATVIPRLPLGVRDGWQDTAVILGEGCWRNLLDGTHHGSGGVMLDDLFAVFPVALLERDSSPAS